MDLSIFIVACEIFSYDMWDLVPWSGIEPGPTALGAQSLSHWTTREVLESSFWRGFGNVTIKNMMAFHSDGHHDNPP